MFLVQTVPCSMSDYNLSLNIIIKLSLNPELIPLSQNRETQRLNILNNPRIVALKLYFTNCVVVSDHDTIKSAHSSKSDRINYIQRLLLFVLVSAFCHSTTRIVAYQSRIDVQQLQQRSWVDSLVE